LAGRPARFILNNFRPVPATTEMSRRARALPLVVALLACLAALALLRPTRAQRLSDDGDYHDAPDSAAAAANDDDDDHWHPSPATGTGAGTASSEPSEPDDLLAAFDEAMHAQQAARSRRTQHASAFQRLASDPAPSATPSTPIVVVRATPPPTEPPRRYAAIGINTAFDPAASIAWLWSPRAVARATSILDSVQCATIECAQWRAQFRRARQRPCTKHI
jgi:hypothetical protein